MFTVLTERAAPIHELLLVHGAGFLPLARPDSFARVRARLEVVAADLGMPLVTAATNVFHLDTKLPPAEFRRASYGSLMGAIALALEGRYARVLLPSSMDVHWHHEWGTHALTDPLASTSRTAVVADGFAYSRMEKTAAIAGSELALSVLRVCNESGDETNCMVCEKCLRTALALETLGALRRAPTLGGAPLDLGRIARIPLTAASDRYYFREIEAYARAHGRPDVARAIGRLLRRSERREAGRKAALWVAAGLRRPLERLRHVLRTPWPAHMR